MEQAPQALRASLLGMIGGYRITAIIHVAARLGIADHLLEGATDAAALAATTATHAPSLLRLLRGLAVLGLVDEVATRRFQLTPTGELLCD